MKYYYFVSFVSSDSRGLSYGNCDVSLTGKITRIEDVRAI
jgi:hypothetical protein